MSSKLVRQGIGTPADIPSFVLMGLDPNPIAPPSGSAELIRMGIGTPSTIGHFILFGLTPTAGGGGTGVMRRIGYGGGLVSV